MWLLALKWIGGLIVASGVLSGIFRAGTVSSGEDPGFIGPPSPGDDPALEPNPSDSLWNFGPWKTRREDEWIIGGVLLFIILQTKFWK